MGIADLMCLWIGVRNMTNLERGLIRNEIVVVEVHKAERSGMCIGGLFLQNGPIDRILIKTWRRACGESLHREVE